MSVDSQGLGISREDELFGVNLASWAMYPVTGF